MSNYTQGHSVCTTATHERRTAEREGAFLLRHIKPTDNILDVGCGPGTITTGFSKYASQGSVTGVDISDTVIQKAKSLASEANVPTSGPGSVTFMTGDVLDRLPFEDDTFDVIWSSQTMGHMIPPDQPTAALVEMRRVVKPGGIVASRDAAFQHFYPEHLDLDRLWVGNLSKVVYKGISSSKAPGKNMLAFYRKAGFDVDGGKAVLGAGSMAFTGQEQRKWLAWRASGQLSEGDPFRQSWLDAGISPEEIEETVKAIRTWSETEDAWFASMQCEMLGWK